MQKNKSIPTRGDEHVEENVKSIANCRQEPHMENWLRQADRRDPRSGRVAAKIRSRDVTRIQDKVQDKVQDKDQDKETSSKRCVSDPRWTHRKRRSTQLEESP